MGVISNLLSRVYSLAEHHRAVGAVPELLQGHVTIHRAHTAILQPSPMFAHLPSISRDGVCGKERKEKNDISLEYVFMWMQGHPFQEERGVTELGFFHISSYVAVCLGGDHSNLSSEPGLSLYTLPQLLFTYTN